MLRFTQFPRSCLVLYQPLNALPFRFWKPVTNPQRSTLHAGMIGSEDSEAFPNLSMV